MPAPTPLVTIRPITPADGPRLTAFHDGLSAESRRRRFLSPKLELSRTEVRYLTDVDGADHVALVAVCRDEPERIVGVGRFVRLAGDPESAEMAVVVADELQGRGLGRLIGVALADAARARGIRRFTATMLSDNVAALRLFEAISRRLRTHQSRGVRELVADLDTAEHRAA